MPKINTKLYLTLFLPIGWLLMSTLILIIASVSLLHKKSPAAKSNYSLYLSQPRSSAVLGQSITADDTRPVILDKYLTSQGAPLAGYGKTLVDAADKYGLDWRLVAAIAMQESNAGKVMPRDSYNAWGWAIYTGKNSGFNFDSWEHAIETVSRGLAVYRDRYGLITPEEIMTRYNPDSTAAGGSWARAVSYFMDLFGSYGNKI
ncbi:MAG: hypothetical protein NT141_00150 [candidate division WWE3 bacterium]|nr:hypothetical protein [candidate division WWE3 bacterium]